MHFLEHVKNIDPTNIRGCHNTTTNGSHCSAAYRAASYAAHGIGYNHEENYCNFSYDFCPRIKYTHFRLSRVV